MTFDSAYWEDRYRTHPGAGCHPPSPHLVGLTADLPAGTALEAGCGEGGNAVWLARQGWRVTAVDIAPSALDRGRRYAGEQGPTVADRIRWVESDLTTWQPPDDGPGYDLVTSHYVHPEGPFEDLAIRLASAVAPDGLLVLVGHDTADAHSAQHAPGHASWRPDDIAQALDVADWEVLEAGTRTRTAGHGRPLHDAVLFAKRAGGRSPRG
ncbi:class I SAM-dependent methyltransferase [Ornithinicoccus hortensis]|uniref:Methyltransferase family protein n=1 Tax=Ornithinicoccus hortensis TaxID=82346 RepID=A0A542YT30_9MICO|nr:class I SAM-dependent methyltransferase [Ornithinicoccus hortensis]TQL51249.1 methyltransferase family protein [Ornithinicoccus hortensis]